MLISDYLNMDDTNHEIIICNHDNWRISGHIWIYLDMIMIIHDDHNLNNLSQRNMRIMYFTITHPGVRRRSQAFAGVRRTPIAGWHLKRHPGWDGLRSKIERPLFGSLAKNRQTKWKNRRFQMILWFHPSFWWNTAWNTWKTRPKISRNDGQKSSDQNDLFEAIFDLERSLSLHYPSDSALGAIWPAARSGGSTCHPNG